MSSYPFSEADNASVRAVMSKAVGRMSGQGNIAGSHPQPYFSFSGPTEREQKRMSRKIKYCDLTWEERPCCSIMALVFFHLELDIMFCSLR